MPPRGSRRGPSTGPEQVRGSPNPSPVGIQSKRTLGNPAKHSESYGSPLAARPKRANLTGRVDITTATDAIYVQVLEERRKKEEERSKAEAEKAARAAQMAPVEEEWSPEEEEEEESSSEDLPEPPKPKSEFESEYTPGSDEGSEEEGTGKQADGDELMPDAEDTSPSGGRTRRQVSKGKGKAEPEKAPAGRRGSRKRKQEAREAEDREKTERETRDARLREEREREAERVTSQKRADAAKAAAEAEAEARRLIEVEKERVAEEARARDQRARSRTERAEGSSEDTDPLTSSMAAPAQRGRRNMFGSSGASPDNRVMQTPQPASTTGFQLGLGGLQSDESMMTNRSFREESGIFSSAVVSTPIEATAVEKNDRRSLFGRFIGNRDDQPGTRRGGELPPVPPFESDPRPDQDLRQETGAPTISTVTASALERRAPKLGSKQNKSQVLGQQDEEWDEPRDRDTAHIPVGAGDQEKDNGHKQASRRASQSSSRSERQQPQPDQNKTTSQPPRPPPPPPHGSGHDEDSYLHRMSKLAKDSWLSLAVPKRLGFWALMSILLLLVFRVGQDTGHTHGEPIHWYGWDQWKYNLGQFIPPVGSLSDENYADVSNRLFNMASKIDSLLKRSDVMESGIRDLQRILPDTIHVRRTKTGEIIIPDEFWYAVRDWIKNDSGILTLDSGAVSDKHWEAIRKRLKDSGIDGLLGKSPAHFFETWLKNNHDEVARILQDAKLAAPEQPRSSDGVKDTTMTRELFLRELARNLQKHDDRIEGDLKELRVKLEALAKQVAAGTAAKGAMPSGLSRKEATTLVHELVRQAIANVKFDAAALRNIAAHEDTELRRRVNYFSPGNGAMVDPILTSPTWDPRKAGSSWLARTFDTDRHPPFQKSASAALRDWQDPDDCWCAGTGVPGPDTTTKTKTKTHPAVLAVRLTEPIVPQDLVIEHMDPEATLDGGAMPKDIEVWALVAADRRDRARDLMATLFPNTDTSESASASASSSSLGSSITTTTTPSSLYARGYTQIGRFTYAHDPRRGGVYVHRLSPELARMGALTDVVLVRAVTNHGADHTCFYRVRLYGTAAATAAASGGSE